MNPACSPSTRHCAARDAKVGATAAALLAYCRQNDWAGYDPYDGLNSRVFKAVPFLHCKWTRLALIQGMKRSPINFRPLLLVPKTHNAKAMALFLTSLIKLRRLGLLEQGEGIDELIEHLVQLRSPDVSYWCWGYNFDWQNRTTLVPEASPNIVCTTFAGQALLDAFEDTGEDCLLEMAVSAATFVYEQLYQEDGNGEGWFNYTTLGQSQVHNANLLGAYFLARTARLSHQEHWLAPAIAGTLFTLNRQYDDGSWDYGEQDRPSQRWRDNFHTGFNLCALHGLNELVEIDCLRDRMARGFLYYRDHFFREDGAPKYYHNQVFPIDIHSVAQSIVTLVELRDLDADSLDLAQCVLDWGHANLWDPRGYYHYQKNRITNRIPYMRWSQAWMLLALASLLEARATKTDPSFLG